MPAHQISAFFRAEIFARPALNFQAKLLYQKLYGWQPPPPTEFNRWLTGFAGEEFGLVHKLYEFYKLLHLDVSKRFPKTERYILGESLKSRIIILIDGVWEANNLPLPERLRLLDRIQRVLDLVKILIRLAYDIEIYQVQGYLYRQGKLKEIGGMLGQWRKNTRKKLGLDP